MHRRKEKPSEDTAGKQMSTKQEEIYPANLHFQLPASKVTANAAVA